MKILAKYCLILLIEVLFIGNSGVAQSNTLPGILGNEKAYAVTERALDHIYNVEIDEADPLIAQLDQMLPNYPAIPMLRAIAVRAQHYPLEPDSEAFEQMKDYLYEVIDQAEEVLDEDEDHIEANFFMLSAYGLLALYENEDGNYFKAVGQAKSAYSYLKKGFELKDEYPDFYFSSGLYNYYREKYPELHPFYNSFMWFFRDGDKALGLAQMDRAFHEALFLRSEAADYLTHIYLFYENQPEKALSYAQALVDRYPDNLYFVMNYTHAALAAGQFEGTEAYAQRLIDSDQRYYRVAGNLFRGMLLEKRDQRWEEAEEAYLRSLKFNVGIDGEAAENYRSYAYAGLARIADHQQKPAQAKALYEKALDSAQYPPVIQEAEAYLQ